MTTYDIFLFIHPHKKDQEDDRLLKNEGPSGMVSYICMYTYIYMSFFPNFWLWTDSCMTLRNIATEQKTNWASKWFSKMTSKTKEKNESI